MTKERKDEGVKPSKTPPGWWRERRMTCVKGTRGSRVGHRSET